MPKHNAPKSNSAIKTAQTIEPAKIKTVLVLNLLNPNLQAKPVNKQPDKPNLIPNQLAFPPVHPHRIPLIVISFKMSQVLIRTKPITH
jgi:hypothetical protein